MKANYKNGRDLSGRLVVWRKLAKIEQDTQFLELIRSAGQTMCAEILEYPMQVDLDGSFDDVCDAIREVIPLQLFSDEFETGVYTHNNGRDHLHLGEISPSPIHTRTKGTFISTAWRDADTGINPPDPESMG